MTDTTDAPARRLAAVVYNPIKIDLDALKEALEAGATMVMAAGGDGTVRAVAEAVRGWDASLALLPSGTGNMLARNLSLTLNDVDNSVHSAFSGGDRAVDVAVMDILREDGSRDTHTFLVMAGLGLDAKMLANTDDELKKKVGWLAYVKAIITVLRDKNVLRMRFRVDQEDQRRLRAHTFIVANCGSLPGNILLLPEAAVDDGQLDVVILRPEQLIGWLQIIVKVVWENGVLSRTRLGRKFRTREVKALNYLKGTEVTVRLSRPEEIELDGDGFGRATGMRTRIVPNGLTIRVPAPVAESPAPGEGDTLVEAEDKADACPSPADPGTETTP